MRPEGKIQPAEGYANVGDIRLFYRCEGKGTPLLMLHGNGQDHTVFRSYTAVFRKAFRVILADSREHGRSGASGPETELRISGMAADMAKLLDALQVERVILFGFSDGANIALEFASLYPDRTIAVIAANGNALPSGMRLPVMAALWLTTGFFRILAWGCPCSRIRMRANRRIRLNGLMLHSPVLSASRLERIKAPVLLLTGTRDVIRVSHTKWMYKKIPHAKLFLLRGGTHDMLFRHQYECMRAIRGFLRAEHLFHGRRQKGDNCPLT